VLPCCTDDDEDDEGKTSAKAKVSSGKFKDKVSSLAAKKGSKAPIGGWAGFKKRLMKNLFGWMDPRFVKLISLLSNCGVRCLGLFGPHWLQVLRRLAVTAVVQQLCHVHC
jgi:hypothetical protein